MNTEQPNEKQPGAPQTRPARDALRVVMNDLARLMDASEALDPHSVLIIDPATSGRNIVGPFTDRATAQAAIRLLEVRWAADHEPPMGVFEAIPSSPPDQALLTALREGATVLP